MYSLWETHLCIQNLNPMVVENLLGDYENSCIVLNSRLSPPLVIVIPAKSDRANFKWPFSKFSGGCNSQISN